MKPDLKLTCILAHPDDESMGTGGLLAKYAAEGNRTTVITATDGQQGWFGDPEEYPGEEALAEIRAKELKAACEVLGVSRVERLGFEDGKLNQANPQAVIEPIVHHLRVERPQVIVTFDPFGVYGHPDHIAISQLALTATMAAADPAYLPEHGKPHRVDKAYYFGNTEETLDLYQQAFGELKMEINGGPRTPVGWPSWALSTRIDTSEYVDLVWQAIQCHESQLPNIAKLSKLSPDERRRLWSEARLYPVLNLAGKDQGAESDLFEGLR
ncbi:MAG: PIG-L deacetylase family protein [Anaerolineales bacterium]